MSINQILESIFHVCVSYWTFVSPAGLIFKIQFGHLKKHLQRHCHLGLRKHFIVSQYFCSRNYKLAFLVVMLNHLFYTQNFSNTSHFINQTQKMIWPCMNCFFNLDDILYFIFLPYNFCLLKSSMPSIGFLTSFSFILQNSQMMSSQRCPFWVTLSSYDYVSSFQLLLFIFIRFFFLKKKLSPEHGCWHLIL